VLVPSVLTVQTITARHTRERDPRQEAANVDK
jgi:hypothetical protein